jgi:hypothetical protein
MQDFAVHQSDLQPVEYFDRLRVRVCESVSGVRVPEMTHENF